MNANNEHFWQCVSLKGVRLVSVKADTSLDPDALPQRPPTLSLQWDAAAVASEAGDRVEARIDFSMEGATDSQAQPCLSVQCTYVVTYQCTRPPRSDEELEQLAFGSAVFNAWPFWRELAHSIYGRMGLPLPIIPSLSPNMELIQ